MLFGTCEGLAFENLLFGVVGKLRDNFVTTVQLSHVNVVIINVLYWKKQ
jgi:hypothetical protein